jgi:hypothetical protein
MELMQLLRRKMVVVQQPVPSNSRYREQQRIKRNVWGSNAVLFEEDEEESSGVPTDVCSDSSTTVSNASSSGGWEEPRTTNTTVRVENVRPYQRDAFRVKRHTLHKLEREREIEI